jgi:capsular exopolysaccharide synthesis family protein
VSAPPQPEHADLGIKNQASVLWRRKFTILLVTVLAVGSVIVIDLQRRAIYRAQATMEFLSQGNQNTQSAPPLNATALAAAIETVTAPAVQALVAKSIGRPAPPATVALVGATQLAKVTVDSSSPTVAADAANAYVNSYIKLSEARYVFHQVGIEAQLQTEIDQLQTEIDSSQAQLSQTSPQDLSVYTPLSASLSNLYVQQSTIKNQLSNVQLSVTQAAAGAQMVFPATAPSSPFSPSRLSDALIALFVGLAAGCALVLVWEHLDDHIRKKEDLLPVIGTVPVLGLIPVVHKWKAKNKPYLVILGQPTSPTAEAYRVLRTTLQFVSLERAASVIQVTSPSTGDGKTTTVANLAVAMAAAGQRVTIMCCDLRRPRVHLFFDLSNDVGVTSVISGEATLESALQEVPGLPLKVLSSGPKPINPAEIISSNQMQELIAQLRAQSDVVIIDSAPVLPVTDAAALSSHVDGVILVASTYNSTQRQVHGALETLRLVEAPMIGIVLNAASQSDTYYYYGYYAVARKGQAAETEAPGRPPLGRRQRGADSTPWAEKPDTGSVDVQEGSSLRPRRPRSW